MSTENASSGDGGDSVTIVIRSGMQGFSDRKIACSRKWTILQLKEHLSRELSFKPEAAHQRLIYSGHFLDNERTIDSVLSCGGSGVATESADPTVQVFLLVYADKMAMASPPKSSNGGNGLRHRTSAATPSNGGAPPLLTAGQGGQPFAQQNYAEYYAAYYQNYMNHMSQVMQHQYMAAATGFGFPAAGNLFNNGQFPLTPGVPMGWPQAAGGFAAMALPQFAGPNPATLAAVAAAHHANVAAAAAQGAGAQPAVVLQAHGVVAARPPAGENMAAAADGVGNRLDFLELVYKAFRFLLLATLIYGYSSFERLLAVILAIVLLWFVRNQREAAANGVNPAVPQRPPNGDANELRPEAAPAEADRLIDANLNQPATDAIDGNGADPTAAVPPPPPLQSSAATRTNALTLAWSTVCSFFTSLVPEHHVAIE